ncbi:MAG: hypothetical protein ACTMKY_03065 [Dermabacteraceae bacterium]
MSKPIKLFLASFVVMVVSAAMLILFLPSAIRGGNEISFWIVVVLGVIAAASAFYAWQVKPKNEN